MKSMRKLLPVTIATLLISCSKDNDNPNAVNSTDKSFIIKTYLATQAEIAAGLLTAAQGSDPLIKDFARRLGDDYKTMQQDLVEVANKVSFALADTFSVSAYSLTGLSDLSGYIFDTTYINSRVRSHSSLLKIFQDEMNNGNNTYVRYYFLHKHLDKVKYHYLKADSISRLVR